MTAPRHLVSVIALVSFAAAQSPNPGSVRQILVRTVGSSVRVEIQVSSPTQAFAEVKEHPDQLIVVLPGTISDMKDQTLQVGKIGIKDIRYGLDKTQPSVTRVVVNLDHQLAYRLSTEPDVVVLTLQPGDSPMSHTSPPAAGSYSGLSGWFKRTPKSQPDNVVAEANAPAAARGRGIDMGSPTPAADSSLSSSQGHSGASVTEFPTVTVGNSVPAKNYDTTEVPTSAPAISSETGTNAIASDKTAAEPDASLAAPIANPDIRTAFKVKYVAQDAAYLDGGRSSGLSEGVKLQIRKDPAADGSAEIIAELVVVSVAETSAVTEIHSPKRDVLPGDLAYLSNEDQAALVQKNALSATRKYPVVVSFTTDDTLDEEARDAIPKPPLPSVNRARVLMGIDYMGLISHGPASSTSSGLGFVMRTDVTRLGGTYWNVSGYWRGRLNSQSYAGQQTLQDLINRTYHLSMTYDNPNSALVAGFGRMYLPWANSLDTIDGGYFGYRLSHRTTLGIFGGSTPDPTSWDYSPKRQLAGSFINFTGGDYQRVHYSSTTGAGVSFLSWQVDRPFVFFENAIYFKRYFSIYESAQVDDPAGNSATPSPGVGLGRSFFTVRVQPIDRVQFDFNHTYFRDIPTFDPTLVGTGLLDKYLFQGFSGGVHVEVVRHIWAYTELGSSSRTGDASSSLNQMYGITFDRLPKIGMRFDAHYSKFDSPFGSGSYQSFSLSRSLTENLRLEILAGKQNFVSSLAANDSAKFLNANIEASVGKHYFLQGGFTSLRGQVQNYDQWMFTLGYRLDSKYRGH